MPKLVHAYDNLTGGQWLRGNLHTHTTRSDGSRAPQVVVDDYARRGYGYLGFSDHDQLTSDADIAQLDSRGLVLIPGNEISRGGTHMLHVDAERFVEPAPARQIVLNDIAAAARATGRGFAIINHPDWLAEYEHASVAQLKEWTGFTGIEIFNGVLLWHDGSPYALRKWDILLSAGRRVWGFANDDSHGDKHVELGWNTVYVKERTRAAVVAALQAGRFYASTGVTITGITVNGMTVRIETENAQRIVALQNTGKRLKWVDERVMEFEVPAKAKYVRFECWGPGERFAWTQPFFVDEAGGGAPAMQRFIAAWTASVLLPDRALDGATPAEADRLCTAPVKVLPPGDVIAGFADVRGQIQGRGGVVYLRTDLESPAAGRGQLYFGYDGPVRVWLNGEQVFAGPGANPAIPDKVGVYAHFRRGANRLVVALDTNGGRAWGVFGRVELPK